MLDLEKVHMNFLQYCLKRLCEIFSYTYLKNPREWGEAIN